MNNIKYEALSPLEIASHDDILQECSILYIVYRKERFEQGRELPIELIVRDRRYTLNEIRSLCLRHNLKVEFARFVNAKDWDKELGATDIRAKEILIKCTKL